MLKKCLIISILSIGLNISVYAQDLCLDYGDFVVHTTKEDTLWAQKIYSGLSDFCTRQKKDTNGRLNRKSTGEMLVFVAKRMLGTAYVANTLSLNEDEQFRVYLHKTDCILFVDLCLNIVLCANENLINKEGIKSFSFKQLASRIYKSRYRKKEFSRHLNYSDRIHYTLEWINNLKTNTLQYSSRELPNGEPKILTDLSIALGGTYSHKEINYMSEHLSLYPPLKNEKELSVIKNIEKQLSANKFSFIEKDKVQKEQHNIKEGDIICFCSALKGLDISHIAIACKKPSKKGGGCDIHFIHASTKYKKVILDSLPLTTYLKKHKSVIGIKVLRLE